MNLNDLKIHKERIVSLLKVNPDDEFIKGYLNGLKDAIRMLEE